jgi:hypothetical protein
MGDFKKYNEFLLTERKKDLFSMVLNDININVDEVVKLLSEKYNFGCWFLYNNENNIAIGYYQTSDDSKENVNKIKEFLFENLPYVQKVDVYPDDNRMMLRFIEIGDPVKFKFYF